MITGTVTIICAIITANTASKNKKIAEENKRIIQDQEQLDAVKEGLQCLLRQSIISSHDKWNERRYCPIYAKESLTRAYDSYHRLGGNDVATALYKQTLSLPTERVEIK